MRRLLRNVVTLAAIYAVTLNVIFLGLMPFSPAANAADPFSVICHSITSGDQAPVKSGLVPGHACEHCNLCSISEPPPVPDIALATAMVPPRILHVLQPVSMPGRIGTTCEPKLARGPPQPA